MLWYKDKDLKIEFSNTPNIEIIYPNNQMDNHNKKNIIKKPFVLKNEIEVKIIDYKKSKKYNFIIPKEYKWDGATIPRMFWRLIGAKTDPKFLVPSMVHDILCENHSFINNDRYLATKIFDKLLKVSEVNKLSRFIIFHSVDNFQKFCRW